MNIFNKKNFIHNFSASIILSRYQSCLKSFSLTKISKINFCSERSLSNNKKSIYTHSRVGNDESSLNNNKKYTGKGKAEESNKHTTKERDRSDSKISEEKINLREFFNEKVIIL